MPTLSRTRSLGWTLLALCLAGCTSARDLRVASAGSVGCAPAEIDVSQVRGGTSGRSWIARCDNVSFQCSAADAGCVSCAPVRGRGARGRGRGRGQAGDEDAQVHAEEPGRARGPGPRFQFSREGEALRGVRAAFRTGPATLAFTFTPARDPDGLQLTLTPGEGATQAECGELTLVHAGGALLTVPLAEGVGRVLREPFLAHVTRADVELTFRFCGHAWTPSSAERQGFRRLAEHVAQALADASESGSGSAEASGSVALRGPAGVTESSVRAQLDQRGAVLRACAGVAASDLLPVEVTWDAAGVVRVEVRGRDDRAVHECATSVLGDWRAPPGQAGRVIHVLRAP